MTTGMVLRAGSPLTWRNTSIPSTLGIFKSSSTRVG